MTDTAKVDNVYYSVNQYVDAVQYSVPQNATVDEKLLFPLVKNAGDYQIGLQKAKIPLDTIPLTPYNLPLKKYELTLRQGSLEASAYLRQLGASQSNFVWNCSPTGLVSQYSYNTVSGALSLITQSDISSIVPFVSYFAVDDFVNAYVAGSQTQGGTVNQFFVVNLASLNVLSSLAFSQIQGLDLDRGQKLYIADEAPSGSVVKVYSNSGSATEVNLTEIATITTGFDTEALVGIRTICADTNLLVGYDSNKFSIYDTTNFQAIQGFTEPAIQYLGQASSIISSGTGNFVVVDDGLVDNLFVGTSSQGGQFNMITETGFSNGDWYLTSKFAFTNQYMFGIGSNGQTYAGVYNPATASLTSDIFLANSTISNMRNVATYPDRNSIVGSGTTELRLWNGNNIDTNDWYTSDGFFQIDTEIIKSWDYQNSTNKIVAVDDTNNLRITSAPIYPKNFMYASPTGVSTTALQLARQGTALNVPNTTSSIVTDNGTFPLNLDGIIFDSIQVSNGNVLCLANIIDVGNMIYKYDINGNFISSFALPLGGGTQYFGIARSSVGYFAVIDYNGTLSIYSETDYTLIQAIPNACGTVLPQEQNVYISAGLDTVNDVYLIFLSNGTGFYVYKYGTEYTLSFSTNNFVPFGYTTPMWLYQSCFYGAFFGGDFPTLFLMTSGSNANPDVLSAKSLFRVVFTDNTFTAINFAENETVLWVDNVPTPITSNSAVGSNPYYKELYLMNAGNTNQSYDFNGTISVISVLSPSNITSTFQVSNNQLFSQGIYAFLPISCAGNTGYYTWEAVACTGATGFTSVAVSKRNPNEIYVLDGAYDTYKGTLSGNAITFSLYQPPINPFGGVYRSISLTPDTLSYDSTAYCYTISNQSVVGSKNYGNVRIASVARDDVSNQFILSKQNVGYDIYSPSTFSLIASSSLPTANLNFAKNGQDVDAGYRTIYSFQVLVDAINNALEEAYQRLKTSGGTLAEAPTISLSSATGLWTLNYSSDYTTLGNGILLNGALLQLVRYYSNPDAIDAGFYLLKLPPASTSLTQISKSAYLFNKLDKILFQSNTIFVSGSFLGNNSQNQIITDVDVPTENYLDNTGQQLIYSPNFLRVFKIASNNSIDRIQVNLLYSLVDGTQYQLTVNPDQGWSTLLDFVRRF